jgi:hypothetical protein
MLARRGLSKKDAQQHARERGEAQAAARHIETEVARLMPQSEAFSTGMTQEAFEARVDAVVDLLGEQLIAFAEATPSVRDIVSSAANRAAVDVSWRIHHVSSAARWPVGMGSHWLRHAPTLTGAALERRLDGSRISGASQFERSGMAALLQVRSALRKRSVELVALKPGRYVIYLQAEELRGRGLVRAAGGVAAFAASPYVAAVWEREKDAQEATLITLYPMAPEGMTGRSVGVFTPVS